MHSRTMVGVAVVCASVLAPLSGAGSAVGLPQATADGGTHRIDLAALLAAGQLEAVNREVAALPERPGAVRVSERAGAGVIWIEGSDFAEGTIDVDVRGRDVLQQSFVGIAFHRTDDATYEVVYLRPFNFRATDSARRQHALQYAAVPDYDWPRLRQEFPEEFENPVDASVEPTGWVPLRVIVGSQTVEIRVGAVEAPTLDVRKLGTANRGMIGLWVGNNSNGDFANLRVTPVK